MTAESFPARRPPLVRPLRQSNQPLVSRARGLTRALSSPAARPHLIAHALFIGVGLWLARGFLFSSKLPAGTDMLDLLARARQNADWGTLLSAWSPSGLGSERQASLDNALGLLTLVVGSPVRSVELLVLALLVVAGATTYLLTFRWYGSSLAAAVAGVLYMTSQAMLGRVASGWLHYELLIALAPALVYVFVALVDGFTVRRALLLTVIAAAITFARQDMILWIAPALGLYIGVAAFVARRPIVPLTHAFAAFAVFVPAILALSAYLLLPLAAGIHAPWLSTGRVFEQIRFNLLDRSLSAFQSVLGLGRDLGYLPSSGQEWWKSHPYVPLPVYYGTQAVIIGCACLAVRWYRDRRTLYLLGCFVVSAFLAKGIRGPLGQPYWWAVEHVPVFGNLRGPNRWLIAGALAFSILTALTFERVLKEMRKRAASLPMHNRARPYGVVAVLAAALFLPVAPTLASGFESWSPTASQLALMEPVARDDSDFVVASVPYGQSMQFVQQPGYEGWEHDLGVESALFTGHSAVSTNSWDRRGSDFVDYTAGVLGRQDPAFAELLGSIGVKYVLGFNSAPSAPELVAPSGGGRLYQQRAVASFGNLQAAHRTRAGTLYAVKGAAPFVSLRSNIAVVLGGRSGLGALADLPGIRLRDWATFVADDVLSGRDGSVQQLAKLIRQADLVMVSGASTSDLAVLGARPVVQVDGVTSNDGDERRVGLLLTDESARSGSLADQSILPSSATSSTHKTFFLPRRERLELWTRVLAGPNAGRLTYLVDGRPVGRLLPLAPGGGGFRWVHVDSRLFAPGRHQIDVIGTTTSRGQSFEVDESRLIRPADRKHGKGVLTHALAAVHGRIAKSIDLAAAARSGRRNPEGGWRVGPATGFWRPQDRTGVRVRTGRWQGAPATRLTLTGARRFYTVAYHDFPTARSFAGQGTLAVRFWGTGSGERFDLLVDVNRTHTRFLSFPLVDATPGWQSASIRIDPDAREWNHVVSLRIATKDKDTRGVLALTTPTVPFPAHVLVDGPTISKDYGSPRVTGDSRGARLLVAGDARGRRALRVTLPIALASRNLRLVIPPRTMPKAAPSRAVPYERHGTSFAVRVSTKRRAVLVLNQAYDPKWQLQTAGGDAPRTAPVAGVTNGFLVAPGTESGVIKLDGGNLAPIGAIVSIAALLVIAGALATWRVRTTPQMREPRSVASTPVPIPVRPALAVALASVAVAHFSLAGAVIVVIAVFAWSRWQWTLMLGASIALLGAGVFFSSVDRLDLADRTALLLLTGLGLAVGRLLMLGRRQEVR